MITETATITTTTLYEDDALCGIDHEPAGAMYPNWIGLNYDTDLDIVTIAKIVRTEVRKAMKAGALGPVSKVSVRVDRYSMGHSVDVWLTVPNIEVTADTPGAVEAENRYGDRYWAVPDPTRPGALLNRDPAATLAKWRVERFVSTFNYNRSNGAVDYFDTSFHSSVNLVKEKAS